MAQPKPVVPYEPNQPQAGMVAPLMPIAEVNQAAQVGGLVSKTVNPYPKVSDGKTDRS